MDERDDRPPMTERERRADSLRREGEALSGRFGKAFAESPIKPRMKPQSSKRRYQDDDLEGYPVKGIRRNRGRL